MKVGGRVVVVPHRSWDYLLLRVVGVEMSPLDLSFQRTALQYTWLSDTFTGQRREREAHVPGARDPRGPTRLQAHLKPSAPRLAKTPP